MALISRSTDPQDSRYQATPPRRLRGVLLVVQSAVSVTGAVYWRQGSAEKKVVFDCVVILSWLIFVTLGVMTAQDKVKLGND